MELHKPTAPRKNEAERVCICRSGVPPYKHDCPLHRHSVMLDTERAEAVTLPHEAPSYGG